MVEAVDDRYMHQALRSELPDRRLSAWNINDSLNGAKLSFGSGRMQLGGSITSI